MKLSPEVLIYIQTVKNYFKSNEDARNYFLTDGNEDFFFKHLGEISQKNFKENGEVMLSKVQFELLRKTTMVTSIANTTSKEDEVLEKVKEDNIFIEIKNFGKICLN